MCMDVVAYDTYVTIMTHLLSFIHLHKPIRFAEFNMYSMIQAPSIFIKIKQHI